MKLFTAIKIPQNLARDISRVQRGVSGARWSAAEKLHITTGYYGEVDGAFAEILDQKLASKPFPSFEMELEGAGHFGNARPHALWLGVKDNVFLRSLHQHCKSSARLAGLHMDNRNFKPHVTVAYLKPSAPLERIIAFEKRLSNFNCKPFLVDRFFLFSSHKRDRGQNLYRIEAQYPLLGIKNKK